MIALEFVTKYYIVYWLLINTVAKVPVFDRAEKKLSIIKLLLRNKRDNNLHKLNVKFVVY